MKYFNKKVFFLNILLIFIKLRLNKSGITLSIEILSEDNYYIKNYSSHQNFIKNSLCKEIFAIFEMGTPIQRVPLFIAEKSTKYEITSKIFLENIYTFELYIKYNFSSFLERFSYFNENMSKTFKTKGCKQVEGMFEDHAQNCLSNESFYFYNNVNMNNKIEFKNLFFNLVKNKDYNITGEIGLGPINNKYQNNENNFFKILKERKIIDNYNWYFNFDYLKDKKGKLIIGSLPHEDYPNKFSEKDLLYTNIYINSPNYREYQMEFDKVYFNSNILSSKIVEFSFEKEVLMGTKELETLIIEFIKNKECYNQTFNVPPYYVLTVTFFYCNQNLKEEFYNFLPSIKFFSKDFNFTFEITKEDLFKIEENYIYLNILFPYKGKYWIFGKPITLKYPFVFNSESKKIGFYRRNNEISNDKNYFIIKYIIKIIIIIIISIGLILFGIRIGKIIYGIRRKKANELLDDYEYNSNGNQNKDINQQLKIANLKENINNKDNSQSSIEMRITN